MNKKGAEWPSFLISTIFTMLLFLIGVFMIVDLVEIGASMGEERVEVLNFGLHSARMLNSADCLAWEERLPSGEYIVPAGVIDAQKILDLKPSECLKGRKWYVDAYFADEKGDVLHAINKDDQAFADDFLNKKIDTIYYDTFAVKILSSGKLYDGFAIVAIK